MDTNHHRYGMHLKPSSSEKQSGREPRFADAHKTARHLTQSHAQWTGIIIGCALKVAFLSKVCMPFVHVSLCLLLYLTINIPTTPNVDNWSTFTSRACLHVARVHKYVRLRGRMPQSLCCARIHARKRMCSIWIWTSSSTYAYVYGR